MGNLISKSKDVSDPLVEDISRLTFSDSRLLRPVRIRDGALPDEGENGDELNSTHDREGKFLEEDGCEACEDDLTLTCRSYLGEKTDLDEEAVIAAYDVKMYTYISITKEWKRKGEGRMYVVQDLDDEDKCRVVMWMQGTGRLVCNFRVFPDFKVQPYKNNTRALLWSALNFAVTPKWETLACQFMTVEDADDFKHKLLHYSNPTKVASH